MRLLLIYMFVVLSGFQFHTMQATLVKWVVIKGSSLKVDGSTNVNNFSCVITDYNRPDTIYATRNSVSPVQLNGNIRLDVQSFDCHNSMMTADLRKTLKSKEFPKLTIRFLSISLYPDAAARQKNTKGAVIIEIAGVSKRFEVDYKVVSADHNYISLVGTRKVNFSDFNITPPRKLGGMIRTNNELSVQFNLNMKVVR